MKVDIRDGDDDPLELSRTRRARVANVDLAFESRSLVTLERARRRLERSHTRGGKVGGALRRSPYP